MRLFDNAREAGAVSKPSRSGKPNSGRRRTTFPWHELFVEDSDTVEGEHWTGELIIVLEMHKDVGLWNSLPVSYSNIHSFRKFSTVKGGDLNAASNKIVKDFSNIEHKFGVGLEFFYNGLVELGRAEALEEQQKATWRKVLNALDPMVLFSFVGTAKNSTIETKFRELNETRDDEVDTSSFLTSPKSELWAVTPHTQLNVFNEKNPDTSLEGWVRTSFVEPKIFKIGSDSEEFKKLFESRMKSYDRALAKWGTKDNPTTEQFRRNFGRRGVQKSRG